MRFEGSRAGRPVQWGLPLRSSMIAETAITTRTSARLMTATVLALTAKSTALRAASLDHLVGDDEQRRRHVEIERLRGFHVDHQLVLGWRLYGQVGRLLALEGAIDV